MCKCSIYIENIKKNLIFFYIFDIFENIMMFSNRGFCSVECISLWLYVQAQLERILMVVK